MCKKNTLKYHLFQIKYISYSNNKILINLLLKTLRIIYN
jgi:hypothetical protein